VAVRPRGQLGDMPDATWWMRSATVAFEAGENQQILVTHETRIGDPGDVHVWFREQRGRGSSVLDTAGAQEGRQRAAGRARGARAFTGMGRGPVFPRRGRDPDGARPRAPGVSVMVSRMATPSLETAPRPHGTDSRRGRARGARSAAGSRSSVPLTWANTPTSIDGRPTRMMPALTRRSRPEVHEVPGPQVDLDGRSGALQDNDVVMIRETLERCLRNRGEHARVAEVLVRLDTSPDLAQHDHLHPGLCDRLEQDWGPCRREAPVEPRAAWRIWARGISSPSRVTAGLIPPCFWALKGRGHPHRHPPAAGTSLPSTTLFAHIRCRAEHGKSGSHFLNASGWNEPSEELESVHQPAGP